MKTPAFLSHRRGLGPVVVAVAVLAVKLVAATVMAPTPPQLI